MTLTGCFVKNHSTTIHRKGKRLLHQPVSIFSLHIAAFSGIYCQWSIPAPTRPQVHRRPEKFQLPDEGAWSKPRAKNRLTAPPPTPDGMCVIFLRHSWLPKNRGKERKQMADRQITVIQDTGLLQFTDNLVNSKKKASLSIASSPETYRLHFLEP